jgi:hypothetical protein
VCAALSLLLLWTQRLQMLLADSLGGVVKLYLPCRCSIGLVSGLSQT